MTRDHKKAENARKNGRKGGNPKLRASAQNKTEKDASDKGQDNPSDKGGDKAQKPEARYQKEENPPTPQQPRDDGAGGGQEGYAYRGKTIRLTRKDFDQWEAAFHTIADLKAELIALDAWLQGPDVKDATRKKWFMAVSGALNKKHQENLARGSAQPAPRNRQEADEAEAQRAFEHRYPLRKITLAEAEGMMAGAELERWKARNLHS